jgi:hypothetical protein
MECHKMEKTITEINCSTGEEITRPLTEDELAQLELDKAELAAKETEAEAKAQAKANLLAKLGITADEAKLLLG